MSAGPDGTSPPRAARGWLDLRRAADTEARDRGAGHLPRQLAESSWRAGARRLLVVDVGAGTGANRRYLGPRLPMRQRWVVVDRDADHLRPRDHPGAQTVVADVADLGAVVAGLPREPDDQLVLTCSALLDVLTGEELEVLADTVVRHRAAVLLSLSVTGDVRWDPPDPDDALLRAAFDAHQRRGGRLGPDAPGRLVELLGRRGRPVEQVATDWALDAGHGVLLGRFARERVDAALEVAPREEVRLRDWWERRGRQVRSGRLRAVVGHVDLFAHPGEPVGRRRG